MPFPVIHTPWPDTDVGRSLSIQLGNLRRRGTTLPPSPPRARRYLECGILACGFARAHCDSCGHDFLVAFSCKGRGICPSCTTRRMAETAAHLVEHVFPQVPVSQWVVTFVQRCGSALNAHTPLHLCLTDGVFSLDTDGALTPRGWR